MMIGIKYENDYSDGPLDEEFVHTYLRDNLRGIEEKIDFLVKNYATLLEKLVDKNIISLDDATGMLDVPSGKISYIVVTHNKP